jgi:signal transduction histidine kinase/CheY-like chemotaxis protein
MGVMRSITLLYCGVSFAVGCIYLVLAARRVQSLLHGLFAGLCLTIPFYAILTLCYYDAATLAAYDVFWRAQLVFTGLLLCLLIWFGWKLSDARRKLFPAVFTVALAAFTVVRFFHPYYFIYTAIRGLKTFTFVTGERIRVLDADPSVGYFILFTFVIVSWAYLMWRAVTLIARKERKRGIATLMSAIILILFPLNDLAVIAGLYNGVYVAELGMGGFVILMGLSLADDVIQKERMRLTLNRTSGTLERILDHTPSLVLVTDGAGRVILANARVHEFLGVPLAPASLANHPVIADLLRPPAAGDDESKPYSLRLTHHGEEFDFLNVRFAIPDATGGMKDTGVVATDITALRRMETDLQQSEKLRALGLLAGGVAHDFNNQLTSLLGYTELIQESAAADPVLRQYTRAVMQAVDRSRELVGRLLAFARKGKTAVAPLRLDALLRETLTLLEHSFNRNIDIRHESGGPELVVNGDRSQLQNVILNLAFNARDAMPEGGRLSFRLSHASVPAAATALPAELSPGRYALLEVEDSGSGIAPEVLPHIFEPFYTTKPEGEGTGMGLAAVLGTVRGHGGAVTVKSLPGTGTTFFVSLPLCAEGTVEEREEPQGHAATLSGKTVWVVDDEELIRSLIRSMLGPEGAAVGLFASGNEFVAALETARREQAPAPHALILDMILPGLGCREIMARFRGLYPQAPVVLISGFTKDHDIRDLQSAGGVTFLPKPFRKSELLTALAVRPGPAASRQSGRRTERS